MCLICVEFEKEKLTVDEARRNLGEMRVDVGEEHAQKVEEMIDRKEIDELFENLDNFQILDIEPIAVFDAPLEYISIDFSINEDSSLDIDEMLREFNDSFEHDHDHD